jgi:subtilase family serine protease
MEQRNRTGFPSGAAALACLLGLTTVLAGLASAQAQTQAETRFGSTAASASLQTIPARLAGQTHPAVLKGKAVFVRHFEPSKMLRLAIALALPHPEEEDRFLEEIQDKSSPLFRQFLSSEEWDARFAPTPETEQAIVDWATSQGLTVTKRYPGRLVVDVEAPAGVIEKALQVTINTYLLPANGRAKARTVYANDRDPVLPASIRPFVHSIHGLNSIALFHSLEAGDPAVPHAGRVLA